MGTASRGSGRRTAPDVKLQPGQYLTNDFPEGPSPHVALDKGEFTIDDPAEPVKSMLAKSRPVAAEEGVE